MARPQLMNRQESKYSSTWLGDDIAWLVYVRMYFFLNAMPRTLTYGKGRGGEGHEVPQLNFAPPLNAITVAACTLHVSRCQNTWTPASFPSSCCCCCCCCYVRTTTCLMFAVRALAASRVHNPSLRDAGNPKSVGCHLASIPDCNPML